LDFDLIAKAQQLEAYKISHKAHWIKAQAKIQPKSNSQRPSGGVNMVKLGI
jgi:hypothetical protein